jgi:hypothetical protein
MEEQNDEKPVVRFQFSLATLMIIVTLCAVEMSLYSWLGPHGLLALPDLFVIALFVLKRAGIKKVCGYRVLQLSFIEFFALAAMLLVSHGLCCPAVSIE